MVPCLASHAHHIWDDWGCPDVRSLAPAPRSQHRPTSALTAARLGSPPRFLDIGHARLLVPLRPCGPRSYNLHAQFRPAHHLPHEVSPLRCPVPRTRPCHAPRSPLFHITPTPSSRYLNRRGTDMLEQDGLGFSASTLLTAPAWVLSDGRHTMAHTLASSHGHSERAQNFLAWRNPLHGCGSSACSNHNPNLSHSLDTRPNHGSLLPVRNTQLGTCTWHSIIDFGHRQAVAAGRS